MQRRRDRGHVELWIVVWILAVVACLALVIWTGSRADAKEQERLRLLRRIADVICIEAPPAVPVEEVPDVETP